jgi:protease-4
MLMNFSSRMPVSGRTGKISSVFCMLLMFVGCMSLAGCGDRALQISLVPVSPRIRPQVVHKTHQWFNCNRVAIVDVSGMLLDGSTASWLGSSHNPVSDFAQTLHSIAKDPRVKAVVLRMNTPGGTVTASTIMYNTLKRFERKTHKPVVVSMMDVCASGGYYLSCAADYQMAYPTTITGSVGVIVQLFNFRHTLQYLGVTAPAFASGPDKETGSPFSKMTPSQKKIIQGFVREFFARFVHVVKSSHPQVNPKLWPMLTDGRPLTGIDALRYHMIDALGGLHAAIRKAKALAHIKHATIVLYKRNGHDTGSIYAKSNLGGKGGNFNMVNVNLSGAAMSTFLHPNFLYMWEQ